MDDDPDDLLRAQGVSNLEKAQKSIEELDELNILANNLDTEKTNLDNYQKDYEKADSIREELLNMGIQLIDTKEGTTYKRI